LSIKKIDFFLVFYKKLLKIQLNNRIKNSRFMISKEKQKYIRSLQTKKSRQIEQKFLVE
jgi:hypothetical protein